MKDIEYIIEFFSDWHCGAGLASGADVDALVIRDKDNLPFVPGKTIKGLIKEAVEDINQITSKVSTELIHKAFGYFDEKDTSEKGYLFFSNAEFPEDEKNAILKEELSKHLYRTIASTAIEDGTAKKHSLRKTEVVIPCALTGHIIVNLNDINEDPAKAAEEYNTIKEIITEMAFPYIKRLGQNRNRGYGRCKFSKKEVNQ